MWCNLPSGLKDWLLVLGFDRQNLSDAQIENEFQRLTPPEMRDIWRSMMAHVVPVEKKRYVKKVLLLNELKKQRTRKESNLSLPKNLSSVADLEKYKIYNKAILQLNNRELLLRDQRAKVEELEKIHDQLNEERKCLVENKEMQNHKSTLIRLRSERYKKLEAELVETRDCLKYVSSNLLSLSGSKEKIQPTEKLMKTLIEKVHEFGNSRRTLNDDELLLDQEKLQANIVDATVNVAPSALQKNVTHLLENVLSALLRLREEQVLEKTSGSNNVDSEWEPSELKKQCVRVCLDNSNWQKKVKAQEERFQEQRSALASNFETHCKDENAKVVANNWLNSECLKQQMISRHKFLSGIEKVAKEEMSSLSDVVFSNAAERNKFFKRFKDMNEQMMKLEKEINDNLCYLSDKSIDLFVNYQLFCKNEVEKLVRRETSSNERQTDVSVELSDLLNKELHLLENMNLQGTVRHTAPTTTNIVEYARRTNFLLHLESVYNSFFERVRNLNVTPTVVIDRIAKVKFSEEDFHKLRRKLLEEAKDNLKSVVREAETCSNNINLWTNFNIDELIPEHMVVDKYTFSQWQERNRAYIMRVTK